MNNKIVFNLPASKDIKVRAHFLMGKELIENLIPIDYKERDLKVSGLISPPGISRKTNKEQRVFINKRRITSQTISNALKIAYENKIPQGTYPPYLLFFKLPLEKLDFNVHPTKREIRFDNESLLRQFIINAINNLLNPKREVIEVKKEDFIQADANPIVVSEKTPSINKNKIKTEEEEFKGKSENIKNKFSPSVEIKEEEIESEKNTKDKTLPTKNNKESKAIKSKKSSPKNLCYLSFFEQYFILKVSETLVLINSKAAQERIYFEKLIKEEKVDKNFTEELLIPINIEVSENNKKFILSYKNEIKKFGLDLEHFGNNNFLIVGVPDFFNKEDMKENVLKIIDELSTNPQKALEKDQFFIPKIMSKNLKFKSNNFSEEEVKIIIEELYNCDFPYSCPYGKPTMINITKNELKKRFGIKL